MGRTKSTPRRELTTIASRIGKKLLNGAEASSITVRTTRSAVLSSLRILVAQPAMNVLLYLDAGLESGYEYARGGILAHRHPNRDGVIVTLDQEPDKELLHLYVGANPLRSAQVLMKERVLGFLLARGIPCSSWGMALRIPITEEPQELQEAQEFLL